MCLVQVLFKLDMPSISHKRLTSSHNYLPVRSLRFHRPLSVGSRLSLTNTATPDQCELIQRPQLRVGVLDLPRGFCSESWTRKIKSHDPFRGHIVGAVHRGQTPRPEVRVDKTSYFHPIPDLL